MIRLTVREGGLSRTVRWDADRVVLGSAPQPGLSLRGAGISPRHCVVAAARDGTAAVLDLGSGEGTIVDGRRVTRARLAAGATLVLGSVSVVVEEWSPRAAQAPPGPDTAPRTPALSPGPRREPSFEESLYLAVRRSPPLLASVAAHGLAALLLFLATPTPPDGSGGEGRLLLGAAGEAALALEDGPSAADAPVPEAPLPGAAPPAEDGHPLDGADASDFADPFAPERGAPPPPPHAPAPLGFGAGRRPVHRDRSLGDHAFRGNPAFDGNGAAEANRRAAGLLAESLGGEKRLRQRLAALSGENRPVIVRGIYDQAEKVFSLLGHEFRTVTPAETESIQLHEKGFVLVACGDQPPSAEAVERLRAFVAGGGFLCTTDWALETVILPAFPGKLRSLHAGAKGISTRNEQVQATLASAAHPLVRGLASAGDDAIWWIEDSAYPLTVIDAAAVTVLVESDAFRRRYGGGALAVHFRHGKGEVLHFVGHVWQKEGNLKGAFGMQRILANFLLRRAAGLPTGNGAPPDSATVTAPDGR